MHPVSETMAHAVTQARSEVRVRHVSMAKIDQLFKIKRQFGKGSFGYVYMAISVLEWKMVTIKMLQRLLRKPLIEITEFKMLQAASWILAACRRFKIAVNAF